MKKSAIKTIILLLTLSFLAVPVNAESGKVYNWYCMRKNGHLQPACESSMSFIEDVGGRYIDKEHGDASPEKVIYLTFDAGYENGNVAKILDVMKAEGVVGSFFVLKHLVEAEPELVKRMTDEGSIVCNHTANHKDMTRCKTLDEFRVEIEALENIYKETTGLEISKFYRPPEGKFTEENLKFASELGYKTVFWSFAYADWDNDHQMSVERAEKKILDNAHNGEIMLLHPTSATNAAVLGKVIRTLRAEGYRFATLDELK